MHCTCSVLCFITDRIIIIYPDDMHTNFPLALIIIMPRCACASEVYGSVFVCLCVCVSVCLCRLLQLLKDQRSASKSFYRLLVMFSWILILGFAK